MMMLEGFTCELSKVRLEEFSGGRGTSSRPAQMLSKLAPANCRNSQHATLNLKTTAASVAISFHAT